MDQVYILYIYFEYILISYKGLLLEVLSYNRTNIGGEQKITGLVNALKESQVSNSGADKEINWNFNSLPRCPRKYDQVNETVN